MEENETKKDNVKPKYIEFEINADENREIFENGTTVLNGIDITDYVVELKVTLLDVSEFPEEDKEKWEEVKSKILDKLKSKRIINLDDGDDNE